MPALLESHRHPRLRCHRQWVGRSQTLSGTPRGSRGRSSSAGRRPSVWIGKHQSNTDFLCGGRRRSRSHQVSTARRGFVTSPCESLPVEPVTVRVARRKRSEPKPASGSRPASRSRVLPPLARAPDRVVATMPQRPSTSYSAQSAPIPVPIDSHERIAVTRGDDHAKHRRHGPEGSVCPHQPMTVRVR
jgi:hypothetical protein